MLIKKAEYILSSPDLKNCPKGYIPEFAFCGRSNVGKSSLINMLTGNGSLAKTSAKPGKTRMMNFFNINDNWRLVDLPGYGYAGVSKDMRKKWTEMIGDFITQREQLYSVFVLIDSRIEPQQIDIDYVNWLGENEIPFSVVFTKTDKSKTLALQKNINAFMKRMHETWDELPQFFSTSAFTGKGKDEILAYIEGAIKNG
jgi:GTP-binding protein